MKLLRHRADCINKLTDAVSLSILLKEGEAASSN